MTPRRNDVPLTAGGAQWHPADRENGFPAADGDILSNRGNASLQAAEQVSGARETRRNRRDVGRRRTDGLFAVFCKVLCTNVLRHIMPQDTIFCMAKQSFLDRKIDYLGLQNSQSWLAKQTVLGCKKDCFGVQKRQNKGKKRKKRGSERLNPAFSVVRSA